MKKVLLGLFMGLVLATGVSQSVMAADPLNLCDDPGFTDKELREAAGCREGEDQKKTIFPAVEFLINIALSIVGIVGVIVIIYGGITYVISTGDAAKVSKAKNIILYGIVGLVVALLAFAIVQFVSKSIFSQV